MRAIILCAGYATRMYPLTLNFPKPLLSVGGKEIISWLTEDILSCGITEIDVVTNHKFYPMFLEWSSTRPQVRVLDDGSESNEARLGALRDIKFVLEKDGIDEDVLVLAGDNVLDFSFRKFIEYAGKKNSSCVMRHYQGDVEKLRRTGVCTIADDDRILSMEEKPENPASFWAVPPFYYYKKEDLPLLGKAIGEGISTDAPGSFVLYLASHSTVYAFLMNGSRYDVGTIEGYEKLKGEYRGITKE